MHIHCNLSYTTEIKIGCALAIDGYCICNTNPIFAKNGPYAVVFEFSKVMIMSKHSSVLNHAHPLISI